MVGTGRFLFSLVGPVAEDSGEVIKPFCVGLGSCEFHFWRVRLGLAGRLRIALRRCPELALVWYSELLGWARRRCPELTLQWYPELFGWARR